MDVHSPILRDYDADAVHEPRTGGWGRWQIEGTLARTQDLHHVPSAFSLEKSIRMDAVAIVHAAVCHDANNSPFRA